MGGGARHTKQEIGVENRRGHGWRYKAYKIGQDMNGGARHGKQESVMNYVEKTWVEVQDKGKDRKTARVS